MDMKAFIDGMQSMIDDIHQEDQIEESVDKVKSQDIPKSATQQGSFMEIGPFIDGLHSIWYKTSNWKIPQTPQEAETDRSFWMTRKYIVQYAMVIKSYNSTPPQKK